MKDYVVEKKKISSTERDIEILVLRPLKNARPKSKTPGGLWIHGGGYRTGMTEMI